MADDKRLDAMEKEFSRYQKSKARRVGGVEARVLCNLAMYVGEQWVWYEDGAIKNKNPRRDEQGRIAEVNLTLNMIAPRQNKILGRLTASNPSFSAFPDASDPAKMAQAEIATKGIRAMNEKLDEEYLSWQRWYWSMMGGWWIEHTPWRRNAQVDLVVKKDEFGDPIWKHHASGDEISNDEYLQAVMSGQAPPEHFDPAKELKEVGDVGGEIRGPLNCFNPNSITRLEDLSPGQSLMLADIKMLDWVKKTWPEADFTDVETDEDFKIVTTSVNESISFVNTSLRDLIPVVQGAVGDDDPAMVTVVERYEPAGEEFPPGWSLEPDADTGPGFTPAPDEDFANGGRYTVFIPGQVILRDGEIPYQDGIPCVDGHWDVAATNFNNPDWCTPLVGPQKAINTLASQMRMLANARIFDPVLMDEDVMPPKTDSPRYWPGGLRDGVPQAARLGASGIDPTYQAQFGDLMKIFDDLAGGNDLFAESRFPGQIRGTGAVSLLQEVQDTQWGPKLRHYYSRVGKVHHKRLMRMRQFYPAVRTLQYTDSRGKVETFEFHAEQVLRSNVDYSISVDPSTILPETRRERFARVQEILSGPMAGLLTDPRSGQVDWNHVANMLQWGEFENRETKLAKDTKFVRKVIDGIKTGRPVAPVLKFQNHLVFLDELEMEMNDDDFFKLLSPETQQLIFQRYQEHQQMMSQLQAEQSQTQIDQGTMDIVRQTLQQTLSKVLPDFFDAQMQQMQSLAQQDPQAFQQMMFAQGGQGDPPVQ